MAQNTYNHFMSNGNGFRPMENGRTRGYGVDDKGNYIYRGSEANFIYKPGENGAVGTWENTNGIKLDLQKGSGVNENYFVRGYKFQTGGQLQ
jgi:hypothetical protein